MDDQHRMNHPGRDPLADLIRRAGRRPAPPQPHYDAVRDAARRAWQSKVQSRRRLRRIYALAASVALVSIAALLSYQFLPASGDAVAMTQIYHGEVQRLALEQQAWQPIDRAGTRIEAGDRLITGAASGVALLLENGVSLRLSSDTELTISSRESVELVAGTAYVDTGSHAGTNAMIVSTPFGSVRDIGTQFEVFTGTSSMRVRVRTGSVEWLRADQRARTDSDEQLDISSDGDVRKSGFSRSHPDWAWVQRLASPPVGRDRAILGYLQWVASELGRNLAFDSPNTALRAELEAWNRDLSGLTPVQVLDLIDQGSDFDYQFQGDGEILVSRR